MLYAALNLVDDVGRECVVSWSIAGRRSALSVAAGKLARAGRRLAAARRAVLPALRLAARLVLVLAGLGLAVAAVAVLAGLGWSLLAGGIACFVLEWIVKDDSSDPRRRP